MSDDGRGMQRLVSFAQRAARLDGGELRLTGVDVYELTLPGSPPVLFTTQRDKALQDDHLHLLGLEHPIVKAWLDKYLSLPPEDRSVIAHFDNYHEGSSIATIWQVIVHGANGQVQQRVIRLAVTEAGMRSPHVEHLAKNLLAAGRAPRAAQNILERASIKRLVNATETESLHRELAYSGLLYDGSSYSSRLLACVEVVT